MNKKKIFALLISSLCLFGCNYESSAGSVLSSIESSEITTSREESSSEELPTSYKRNEDGSIEILDIEEMAYAYDSLGFITHQGATATLENGSLKIINDSGTYKMRVTADDKYDVSQFIINSEKTKYTELDCFYNSEDGKYYEYNLPSTDSLVLNARIEKEKTKSLLNKDQELANVFLDKQYSILGDSISTFRGISNSTEFNSTIAGNFVYYPYSQNTGSNRVEAWEDTYWGILSSDLGLQICVNNSSSGGYVQAIGNNPVQHGCMERCQNLHNDKLDKEPDFITIYLGINDFGDYCNHRSTKQIGSFETISDLKNDLGEYLPDVENQFATAYAMMIDKIKIRYPSARIYASNLLMSYYNATQQDMKDLATYNAAIKYIAKYFDIGFVNMAADIKEDRLTMENYYEDTVLHPNIKGMRKMAAVFENAIIKDLTYVD